MGEESLITQVILHYHPDWTPPKDRAEWNSCLCPFHGDSRPSATVSYENDAFKCFSCPVKGGAINIIMREEGMSYRQANLFAKSLSPHHSTRVSNRQDNLRSRKTPWS